ncbi:MAG: formylglycine-generating enzyme family protein [Planctomycetota bacterium]
MTASSSDVPGLSRSKPSGGAPSVETERGYMTSYVERIPGTEVTFEMIPVPGGEFLMGSPEGEPDRHSDEGPQVLVQVAPCWVAKCEVSWAEYKAYMNTYSGLKAMNSMRVEMRRFGAESEKLKALPIVKEYLNSESLDIDSVTAPTPLYEPDVTYSYGEEANQPAVTMSQFGAKQYTKWLSGITGQEYRLPTEAEWEYAARAGTKSPYSIPDSASLDDYAWYESNSDGELNVVGSKLPNAWGLHDMHGNVAEWVLDAYDPSHYAQLGEKTHVEAAVRWPTKLFPRVIRGGCWFDAPAACRSGARHKSDDPEWTLSDPNLPVSPWWFTEEPASGVGFRIVRPLQPMTREVKQKVWDADIDDIRQDVADRLLEGRGTRSSADPRLPDALQELESAGLID